MTEERVNLVNNLITGIAYRNQYKFKTLSVDDISQSLWVKILTREQEIGEMDLDLIARTCYDYIVDLQRFEMHRNHYSLEDESDYELPVHTGVDDDPITSILSRIVYDKLLEKYDETTPEGIYLRWWMTASNFKDFDYKPNGTYKDGYTHKNLAKLLGYDLDDPASESAYRRLKEKIQEKFKKFLQ